MSTPILATKPYIPSSRPKVVHRSHLVERLNEGLQRKLTLMSTPAWFGKTTLVSAWVEWCERPFAAPAIMNSSNRWGAEAVIDYTGVRNSCSDIP